MNAIKCSICEKVTSVLGALTRGCWHRQQVRVLERDQRFCVLRIRSAHLHVFKSSCQVALRRVLTKNSKWVERLRRAGFQR